jgi:TolB-like protein
VRVGSGGVVPRNAVLDGDALYVANRVSGSVQVFDAGGAAPVPAKRFDASTPFCVRLLPDP